MDGSTLEQELQAVQSIYCMDGECEITDFSGSKQLAVKLKPQHAGSKVEVTVVFQFSSFYPEVLPDIAVRSSFHTRETVSEIQQNAMDFAKTLHGQEMILEILNNIQDKVNSTSLKDASHMTGSGKSVEEVWTAVLQLDHMRAKNKYVKTIEKWTAELCLTGRLIFMGKLILIVIQGQRENIKDYLVKHKTENVDIDSHGRPCKEKMMKVLCEVKCKKRYSNFQIVECSSEKDLQAVFLKCDLRDVYEKFLRPMQGMYF